MNIAIAILIAFAAWHYIYEAIIAPSVRMQLRMKLFELRDRLRWLKHNDSNLSNEAFMIMQDAINNGIAFMSVLGIISFEYIRKDIARDESLRKRIDKRYECLVKNDSEEMQDIYHELAIVMYRSIAINSGGWLAFVIPVACLVYAHKWAINRIGVLLSMTEKDADRFEFEYASYRRQIA